MCRPVPHVLVEQFRALDVEEEGAIARQNRNLRGKQPRLKPAPDREVRRMHDSGNYNIAEIAALFNVSRPTVSRSLQRSATLPPLPADSRSMPSLAGYDQLLTKSAGPQAGVLTGPPVTQELDQLCGGRSHGR